MFSSPVLLIFLLMKIIHSLFFFFFFFNLNFGFWSLTFFQQDLIKPLLCDRLHDVKKRSYTRSQETLLFLPAAGSWAAVQGCRSHCHTQWTCEVGWNDLACLTQPESPPILHKLEELTFQLVISGQQCPLPRPAKLLDAFWREVWPGPDGLLKQEVLVMAN